MHIALVNLPVIRNEQAPIYYPQPLGLMCLSASVSLNHTVSITTPETTLSALLARPQAFYRNAARDILRAKPDIVGLTTRCDCYYHTLEIARHIRRQNPNIPILLGGPIASICDEDTLRAFSFITMVVRGEGEIVFPQLIRALSDRTPLSGIPNLTYRYRGKIRKNDAAPPIRNMDDLPPVDYRLLPEATLQNDMFHIEVGRGCPYNCTFCSSSSFFSRYYRLKSPERIVSEMELVHRTFPAKTDFSFTHDNLTALNKLCTALCQSLIAKKLPFTWRCSSRIDTVNPTLLRLMKDAGCTSIFFGIETGSQRMQRLIGKNLRVDSITSVLDMCHKLGIEMTASFIVGFPEETDADVEDTLRLLIACHRHGVVTTQLHLLSPLLGSVVYKTHKDTLYYSRNHLSDFTNAATQDEERAIKKYPHLFVANYRISLDRYSDYQLAAFMAFGTIANMIPNTLHTLLARHHIPSYIALCNYVANEYRTKRIFRRQQYISVSQLQYHANLFIAALETYMQTNVSKPKPLIAALNEEYFSYALTQTGLGTQPAAEL